MIRLLIIAWATLAGVRVDAFIPPSQFLVDQIVKDRSKIDRMKVTTVVSTFDGEKPTGDFFQDVTLIDFGSGIFQSFAYDEDGKKLFEVERRFRGEGGTPAAFYLLFGSRKELVGEALNRAGIPVQTEQRLLALASDEERRAAEKTFLRKTPTGDLVWVIGDLKSSPGVPQLWVKKDAFQPVRMMLTSGGRQTEIRFERMTYVTGAIFPKELGLFSDEKPILHVDVQKILVNPKFNHFPEKVVGGLTETGKSADEAIRELIEQYYLYLR